MWDKTLERKMTKFVIKIELTFELKSPTLIKILLQNEKPFSEQIIECLLIKNEQNISKNCSRWSAKCRNVQRK